jgi:serine/threonine protein kinase/tetratricopeptide (TPR) repeat protein
MNEPEPAPNEITQTVIGDLLPERVGSLIGPYKLLQKLGEGGFGVVYMAEQERPVRRYVAIKIIKPGMDTGQVIARFESERQALALMDHPNIARVLDAGATESGHPYFVMELVRGVPITEFCDKNKLPPEGRLKLFVDVCHAIQHAHHKGIIHRDIKPNNVLVTLHDGVPVVKVIDFGVAKATVQKLTEKTLFTALGQIVGTPAYMSPEQAEMSGLDIDTRSDVYSLGVLLYELLTGTTPIEDKRLRQAGYAEMQRLIREQDAPKPSTRLSSLGDTATVIATNRGLDVKRLRHVLSGDLDWVVIKSLEKDRNRRYSTPGNFAEDIDRYLKHEAIIARPPSTAYRLRKLIRRNRVAVLTAAAVVVALLIGIAAATWQALRATRAEHAAILAAESEKAAKDDALAREAETKAVLGFVENRVFAAARPEGQEGGLGRDVTMRKAIDAALRYVNEGFAKEPLIEARLRMTLGKSFYFLGDGKTAAQQEEAARAIYARLRGPDDPDTLLAMHNLASSYDLLGRVDEALKLREETLALRRAKWGSDDPDTLAAMNNLGLSYGEAGRYADALELREETLAGFKKVRGPDHPDTLMAMNNLANAYFALSRNAEALKLREETVALYKKTLGPDHPDTLRSMGNLATSLETAHRHAEALKLREETLELRKAKLGADHPSTLISMSALGDSYASVGRHADALKIRDETLALRKGKLGPDHPDTLMSMSNLADTYFALGRHADALKLREEALALRTAKLGPDHPDTWVSKADLAESYNALDRHADALKLREATLAFRKLNLGADDPQTLMSMRDVAQSLVALNRGSEALPLINECLRRAGEKADAAEVIPYALEVRLRQYAKTKNVAGCRQTVEAWDKLHRTDADSLYTSACFHAVYGGAIRTAAKSASNSPEAEAESDRAMALLKQAVAAGYKDVVNLNTDKDLDSLRTRDDFKKLVAGIGK